MTYRKIVDYIFIQDSSPCQFGTKIIDHIEKGYLLYGTPFYHSGFESPIQAMVKYEESENAG